MYTPLKGFGQSQYFDQQATALPGSIAYASDNWLIDSAYVANPATENDAPVFLAAGLGVVVTPNTSPERQGLNMKIATAPTASTTAADFAGVVVRNEQMSANERGNAGMYSGSMLNIMRPVRAGGRIWVSLAKGAAASTYGGAVYWVVADTAGTGKAIGSFTTAAVSGDTVALTDAKFLGEFTYDDSKCDNIALIELGVGV